MSFTKAFQIYVYPVVFVIGIIGNGLSLVVMTRKSLRGQVTSFYLALLAVFDTLALMSGMVPNWYFGDSEVRTFWIWIWMILSIVMKILR